MRFSLGHLLLIFPVWCIAYLIAPYTLLDHSNTRTTYRYDVAGNDIRQIRLFFEVVFVEDHVRTLDQVDFNSRYGQSLPKVDPWGNLYQVIELHHDTEAIDKFTAPFHAYSCGRDGKTQTDGNDADDINSWKYDVSFYSEEIDLNLRSIVLMRTLWLTPLLYLVLLFGYRTMWPKRSRTS